MDLEEKVRQLENRCAGLEKLFALQSAINGKLLQQQDFILLQLSEQAEGPAPTIIMPPTPKLVS